MGSVFALPVGLALIMCNKVSVLLCLFGFLAASLGGGRTGFTTPASALDLKRVLESAKPCFRRDYTSEHLASHPNQTVPLIQVVRLTDKLDVSPFRMRLNVPRRLNGERYRSDLYCQFASPNRVSCGVEGDGGTLDISIGQAGNKARLKVSTQGITLEGSDFFSFGAITDDRVFYLGAYRRSRCQG